MAIDQEIQRKVDAYRGNPQALQQRYAQNQQLVDLLALQKLKSEMDAAKRDVQMQMQQQPGTIKQQREQELLQRTKQDMMDQTAGVMRQKQAEQQKNLQRVAQGGIGALAPQRPPAPNPAQQIANQSQPVPRMAAGGIVAFQEGGLSSMPGLRQEPSLEDQINLIRRRADLNEGQKQSLINQLLARQPRDSVVSQVTPVGRASSARMPGVMGNIPVGTETNALDVISETRPTIARATPTTAIAAPGAAESQTMLEGPEVTRNQPAAQGIEALAPTAGPDDGLRGGPAPTPAAPSEADSIPTESGGLGGLGVGVGGGSAEAAMERGFARADEYTNRAENAARYAEMEAELAALDEEMYDPAEERRDQLKAFLIGTGGRASTALAGGAAAAMNLRGGQRAARRQRLMDQIELAERGMGLDKDLANLGMQLGREMYAQVSANNRAALSAASSLRQTELINAREAARLRFDERREANDVELRREQMEIDRARNEATERNTTVTALSSALKNLADVEDRELERALEFQGITQLQDSLLVAPESEVPDIEAEIFRRVALAKVEAMESAEAMGLYATQEAILARLTEAGIGDSEIMSEEDLESIAYNE